MPGQPYDLVLYGATGFTGRLAARAFAERAPAGMRLAVAGRSPERLEAVAAGLGREVGRIVADAEDHASIEAMVGRARVIASTAGPFARCSDPVVAACVDRGVHYADITGETPWVRTLIDRFHERAAAEGARIVPFCGFDSVPSDLGTWALVEWIRAQWGQGTRRVSASFRIGGGGLNGGTAASALLMSEKGGGRMRDPVLLNPPGRRDGLAPDRVATRWDPDRGVWLAPFVMGPINTRVVRRSAALQALGGAPYGERFAYEEHLEVRTRLRGLAMGAALGLVAAALASRPGRALVRRVVPAPGQGPSQEAMDRGFVRCRLVGEAEDGRKALATFFARGDAGNRVTVRILCEAALALAGDHDELPGGAGHGGVLTPATGLGGALLERLRQVGTQVEVAPLGG